MINTTLYPSKILNSEDIADPAVRQAMRDLAYTLQQMHKQLLPAAITPTWSMIFKTADETRNNNAVVADDSMLLVPMLANTRYSIRGTIIGTTLLTPDFKYRHNGPAAPIQVHVERTHRVGGGPSFATLTGDDAYSAADIPMISAADGSFGIWLDVMVNNGANAGNFAFQWAQNTSDPGNTTVWAGSYLEYRIVQ